MKKSNILLILCSASVLLLLSAGTFFGSKPSFSENENRYLQKTPEVSASSILNGRFAKQTETFLSDHIVGREAWITASSRMLSACGVSDLNGTYRCRDGRLVQRITEAQFDRSRYEKNLQQAEELRRRCAEKKIPLTLIAVPTAAYVYKDLLPPHALRFDEDSAFSEARLVLQESFLDLRRVLSDRSSGDTFFRTDHHWNGHGAFLAARAFASCCGQKDFSQDRRLVTLTSNFRGTLYSKVLLPDAGTDVIRAPEENPSRPVTVTAGGKKQNSVYVSARLKQKDKYAVYFGGNAAQTEIYSESSTSCEHLLILKDSFANSFVPYLTDHYRTITMIDTRYYQGDISALAERCDQILLLYSITSLSEQNLHLTEKLLQ